jgi:hypothetical protein
MICATNKSHRIYGEQRPLYEPTPAEIRAACLEIQKEWTDSERRRRSNRRSNSRAFHRVEFDQELVRDSIEESRRAMLLDVA